MTSLVLDTHAFIWYLNGSSRLPSASRQAIRASIEASYPSYVSTITIVEVTYLVEKARLEAQQLADLLAVLHRPDSGFHVKPFDLAIAETLAEIPRTIIPDMPDRMIAATALHMKLPLVTADSRIKESQVDTIW